MRAVARPALMAALVLLALALVWALWAGPLAGVLRGALAPLGVWLLEQQRALQGGLARELRGNATGTAGAWGLVGLCLAYGFLHAAGPGHGKAVLVAYAAARRASALRLAAVGLAAGLAQAGVAVALVLGLAAAAGLSRAGIEALDQTRLAPLALAAMVGIGLWLLVRAGLRLRTRPTPPPVAAGPASAMLAAARGGPAPGARVYCADPGCIDCGRPHLPDAGALVRAGGLAETLAVIAAAAIRPCSGALLVLLLSWQMGILWLGILGAVAMGLGTAGVTVSLALAAGLGRAGLMRAAGHSAAPRLAAGIEAATGLALVLAGAAVLAVIA